MVELVDTQDLKSCSRKRSAGSIPALSTKTLIHARIRVFVFICFLLLLLFLRQFVSQMCC